MTKTSVVVEPSLFAKKNKKKEKLAAKVAANGATTIGDVAPSVVDEPRVDTEVVGVVQVKSVVWTKPKRTEEDLIRFNALPKPLERNMNKEKFVSQTGLSAFGFSHEQSPLYGGPIKNDKKQKEEELHKRARKRHIGAKNSHTFTFDGNNKFDGGNVPRHIIRNLKLSFESDDGDDVYNPVGPICVNNKSSLMAHFVAWKKHTVVAVKVRLGLAVLEAKKDERHAAYAAMERREIERLRHRSNAQTESFDDAGVEQDKIGPPPKSFTFDGNQSSQGSELPDMSNFMKQFPMGNDMANGLADYLESPAHFWISILFKIVTLTPDQYGLILNDLVMKYACLLRTQHLGLMGSYGALYAIFYNLCLTFQVSGICRANLLRELNRGKAASEAHEELLNYSLAKLGKETLISEVSDAKYQEAGKAIRIKKEAKDSEDDGIMGSFLNMFFKIDKVLTGTHSKSVTRDIIKAATIAGLAMTAYSAGKFDSFSMEGATSLFEYTMKKYTGENTGYGGIINAITGTYNLIYNWFTFPNGTSFVSYLKQVGELDNQIEAAKRLYNESVLWESLTAEQKHTWTNNYLVISRFAESMLGSKNGWKDAKRFMTANDITNFQRTYIALEARYVSDIVAGTRRAPFALAIVGGSSIGKTSVTDILNEFVFTLENVPFEYKDRLIYNKVDADTPFWDGFQPGTLCVVYDDMASRLGTLTEKSGGDPMRLQLAEVINNSKMLLTMAGADQKGKYFMAPAFVQANSNVTDLAPGEIYRFPAIFDRRFDIKVYLKVKDEFAINGTLDKAKVEEYNLRKPVELIDEPDDFWEWHIYSTTLFNAEKSGSANGGKPPEMEITTQSRFVCKFDHTLDFLAYFKEQYLKHRERQFALLNMLKRPKRFERLPTLLPEDLKVKVEAKEGIMMAIAGVAAVGTLAAGYCAASFVHRKCKQVDELLEQTKLLTENANSTIQRVNETHADLANRAQLAMGVVNTFTGDASDAFTRTMEYLKKVLAALACVAGVIALIKYSNSAFKAPFNPSYQGATLSMVRPKAKEPEVHPNDLIARYEPPMSSGFAHFLTKQSQANQGYNLYHKVKAATTPIVFISDTVLDDGTNRTIKSHCFFVRGHVAAFNLHALPTEARGPLWADWTLKIEGCATNATDVYMTKAQVLMNLHRYSDRRDLVTVCVPKSRDYPDLTNYLPDLPGESFDKYIPAGYHVCVPNFATRVKENSYYGPVPPEITHMGPVGVTVHSHRVVRDRDDSKLLSVVRMNVMTGVGDCGMPYMGFMNNGKNNNLNVIYGLHMGVNECDPVEKLVVPLRKQDFEHISFSFVAEEPVFDLTLDKCSLEFDCSSRMKLFKAPAMTHTHHMKDPTKTWIEKTVAEVNGSKFEPTGSGWFYGQRQRFCSATFQSKVQESPLARILREKDFSHLPFDKFGSGRVIMKLSKQQVANGCAVALSKGYSQPLYNRVLADKANFVVDNIVRLIEEDMAANPDDHVLKHLQPVSKEVALNGMCAGENGDVRLKGLEGVNKQTSAGYPNNEGPTPTGRKGKLGFIIQQPGQPDKLHEDMDKAWEDLRACMATGEYRLLMQAVIKDEAMKPEKLAEGRIRFIIVMPMEGVLLIREHLVTLCRIMALNPFFFGAMVGVDSSSIQWEQIFNYLSANGALIFDGDFKGFEYALFREITDAIQRLVNKMCALSGNYSKDQLQMVAILLVSMFQVTIDFFGNIHSFISINSSGNPLTTQFNCIGVNLWAGVALCDRLEELLGEYFDPELFYEIWKKLLRMANYGDDLLASMIQSKKYKIQLLNQKIMQEKLARYGVTFTDSAKNTVVTHEYSEVYTFLGRTFSRDHAGRVVAKLEAARIMKALEFTTEHETLSYHQLLRSSLRSVLQESYYYGREAYDGLFAILSQSVAELNREDVNVTIRDFFSSTSGDEFTYDFFDAWFTEKYPKGVIQDKRYDEVLAQDIEECEALYERIAEAMRANGRAPEMY